MTNEIKSDDKKTFPIKQGSPFNSDPHNSRGGKKGTKSGMVKGGSKGKSMNITKKFKWPVMFLGI
jgi:hypothetical protein